MVSGVQSQEEPKRIARGVKEEWSGYRAGVRKPVGRLWTCAWANEGGKGLYMSVWRRVDGDHCLGQSLVGEAEAMKARFAAEVAHKQKEGYMALGRKSRRGLPMWKDGSAVVIALAHSGLAANPVVLAGILREQLLRADSQAGVESLWGQYSALKARLEARLEYGAESGRARAREALESLVDGMRVALA